MLKNKQITVKKRPFKVWVRNKQYQISYKGTGRYVPTLLPPLTYFSNASFYTYPLRFRRVVVRSAEYGYISENSIEAFRKVIAPFFRKKESKIYKFLIRCYSYIPLTKKPSEVRIGGGKGSKIRGFFSPVRPGQILFEVFVKNPTATKSLFVYASKKLPISVKILFI